MKPFTIFIVEDDPWYGQLLRYHLSKNPDYEVVIFETAKACLDQLNKRPDVVSIDFNLPDMTGEELLKRIKYLNQSLPVLVISGQEEISVALNLLKKGAYEYLIKDENTPELLWNSILRIRENASLREEVETLKEQLETKFDLGRTILGQSPAIVRTFNLIERAIKTSINVSITGETGTGKEVVAKAIHFNSDRKKKPFVAVNMAAIPRELIESELFGHEKGAFTGAAGRKTGRFEDAGSGSIFLDEIAELDLSLQSKLLRVLQERELLRVGGNNVVKIEARIITASHKDLAEEVRKGNFREDLYYRLIGLPIELPPLRERGNDILILAKHFIDNFAKENKIKAPVLGTQAKEKLMSYHYPGNVRELKAAIDLACVMTDGMEIGAESITFTTLREDKLFTFQEKTLKEHDADIISHYLKKYNNNVVEVARKLDIGKSTVYNMIKEGLIKK